MINDLQQASLSMSKHALSQLRVDGAEPCRVLSSRPTPSHALGNSLSLVFLSSGEEKTR